MRPNWLWKKDVSEESEEDMNVDQHQDDEEMKDMEEGHSVSSTDQVNEGQDSQVQISEESL